MRKPLVLTLSVMMVLLFVGGAQAQDEDFTASIRIIHLSPNAEDVSVELHPTSEHMDPIVQDEWNELQYLDRTEFQEVVSTQVDVNVTVDGITVTETFTMDPQMHYTIALTGLVIPDELERRAEEENGGFLNWLMDLVTGDDPTDRYLFQPRIHQDELAPLNANEIRIRVAHASPGTDAVDLAFAGEEDPLISSIVYGQESAYVTTELTGELELRIAGSMIPMEDVLFGADITAGQVYTVYLAGTAVIADIDESGVRVETLDAQPDPIEDVMDTTPIDEPLDPAPTDPAF